MNISIPIRENIWKYAYETGLMINFAQFMLHPADDLDLTSYDRKYTYNSHAEIAKISEPYLYEEQWSYQEIKPDYYDLCEVSDKGIYIGDKDIDCLQSFFKEKERLA